MGLGIGSWLPTMSMLTSDSFGDDEALPLTVLTLTVTRTGALRPVSATLTALVATSTTEGE